MLLPRDSSKNYISNMVDGGAYAPLIHILSNRKKLIMARKDEIIQLRKKGGIENIVKNKNGGTVNPMMYTMGSKDAEEGELEGLYRGKQILNTKHFISPIWSDLKKQWSWAGTENDLIEIIKKMKLRYPKWHEKSGEVIPPGDSPADRLLNIADEVFTHPDFYGTYAMTSGRLSLNLKNPKQKFLYLCYKGSHTVDDKSSDDKKSKYLAAGAKYELITPRSENIKAKRDAVTEIEAVKLLSAMDNDEDRMRSIARVMSLRAYSNSTDLNGVFLLLLDTAAKNLEVSGKYGGKSHQERFIELAKLPDEELDVQDKVMTAKLKGILRKRKGFYLFNGNRLEGLGNDMSVIKHFMDPANQDDYIELIDVMDASDKKRK